MRIPPIKFYINYKKNLCGKRLILILTSDVFCKCLYISMVTLSGHYHYPSTDPPFLPTRCTSINKKTIIPVEPTLKKCSGLCKTHRYQKTFLYLHKVLLKYKNKLKAYAN